MKKQSIEKNFKMEIAGRIWTISEVRFIEDFRGYKSIAAQDMLKYQTAVVNHICGEDQELTLGEFELLCSISGMSATNVANALRVDKSTISKWRKQGLEKTIPYVYSRVLKEVVLERLFSDVERRSMKSLTEWYSEQKSLPKVAAA